jgi:hypothetical protein
MYAVRNWLIGGVILLALAMTPAGSQAKETPDIINLDALVKLYEKVQFDHARHIMRVKDCAECHHHTTGTLVGDPNCVRCHKNSGATKVVACRGCHSVQTFSAEALRGKSKNSYHQDKLSLKGAYHQNCLGCHDKTGGPTGCEDCHSLNKAGKAFYHAVEYTPKTGENTHGGH